MPQPYHPPLKAGKHTFAFPHLEPFGMNVESLKAGRTLRVHVRFTTHCFTRKYDAATHPTEEPIIHDAGGRPRSFCRVRYGLSSRLPAAIQALNHPKAAVSQTAQERNWLHSVTIDAPGGLYRIFFELRRAPVEVRHLQDLSLVVESAYAWDPSNKPPGIRGSMGFVVLCGKTYKGEPVLTRR
ncbi:MAG: hypothetical protein EXR07_12060 [Acetobacteraceae bacterium]|nr:hypothetical protein [Acetobacteraceae bacterium]